MTRFPALTDTDVDLAILHLDLHLARPARALDELERRASILGSELQQGREEVLSVPTDSELGRHFCDVSRYLSYRYYCMIWDDVRPRPARCTSLRGDCRVMP